MSKVHADILRGIGEQLPWVEQVFANAAVLDIETIMQRPEEPGAALWEVGGALRNQTPLNELGHGVYEPYEDVWARNVNPLTFSKEEGKVKFGGLLT